MSKILFLSTLALLAVIGVAVNEKQRGRDHISLEPNSFPDEFSASTPRHRRAPNQSMKLLEVVATSDPKNGYATMQIDTGEPETFVPGNVVATGWTLDSIYKDLVILKHGDQFIRLRLDRHTARTPGITTVGPKPILPTGLPEPSAGALAGIIEQKAIYSSGKIVGIRVTPGPSSDAFQSLGLQPGDLITSVNGHRVELLAEHGDLLSFIEEGEIAHLTLIRNGHTHSFPTTLSSIPRTGR